MEFDKIVEHSRTLISKTSKVLHVTHRACMDGCVCQILAKNSFQNITYQEYTPQSLKQFLETSNFDSYDIVLVTDISLYKGFSYYNPKVIFIDHHESSLEYTNIDNVYVNENWCSSVLFMRFLEGVLSIDLSYLKDLILLTNDYDLWQHKNSKSIRMSYLFYFYWNEKFIKRFWKGNLDLVDDELAYIRSTEHKFREYFKVVKIFDLQKINGCIVFGNEFINETCDKLLKEENYKIVFYSNTKNSSVSIRSSIEGFHLGKYLSDNNFGGGHKEAGGLKEPDQLKLQEKLKSIEQYVYENFKDTRKI
jgi:oligoribonuclease NrnB/cAMP/cGMP phosphodiesterase (DHH superfamily)